MRKNYSKFDYLMLLIIFALVLFAYDRAMNEQYRLVRPAFGQSEIYNNMTKKIPAETAQAIIAHAKRPKTLAAIAAVETGKKGTTTTKGRHGEIGIFQVREKDWGFAGRTTIQQVMKADHVLDELVKECNGDEHKAIMRYNGAGPQAKKYRAKVYAELRKINGKV